MNNLYEKIIEKLNSISADYELIKLPEDIDDSVEEHMAFHGDDMSKANVNLVYKTDKGFVVIQKRGDTHIDNKKLRKVLGSSSVRFANEDEMGQLGLEPGIVPITGYDLPIYLDKHLLEVDYLYSTATDRVHALKFHSEDLVKLNPDSAIVDVTSVIKKAGINRIVSGVTPSGNMLHIGNYFGAVKNNIDYGNSIDEPFVFIADLHALTTIKDRQQLENNILNVVIEYLALGLDPEKAIFFRQSDVPAHSQLAVILGNYISYGQMKRMHAFKDKLAKGADIGSINMGLFNYPILMAADILLYKPDGVPVGEDQRQHVELTRDIADNFNRLHGEYFPLPEPLIAKDQTAKVIGTDGERKMSKSLGNIVGIFEEEEVIKKQIMKAYTDPNRLKATDPGVVEGNTVFAFHDLINDDKVQVNDLKDRYRKGTVGDVEVKEELIKAHQRLFAPAREKRAELEGNMAYVQDVLREGARKASIVAEKNLNEIYQLIGL